MVDGDDEYDVYDLRKMLDLRERYPLIIAFLLQEIVFDRAHLHLSRL
jgi:hypothetical protein